MRAEYNEREWIEIADDADLSLDEWRFWWNFNTLTASDLDMDRLVDLLNEFIVGGQLAGKGGDVVEAPMERDAYGRLPRRTFLWVVGQVSQALAKNLSLSDSA